MLGFHGYWYGGKGLEALLQAVAALRADRAGAGARLRLWGAPPAAATATADRRRLGILAAIDQLGLTAAVDVLGPLAEHEVPRSLAACDAIVLPYVQPRTMPGLASISSAALDALAAGVPVVATSVRAMSETVRDGVDGLLVAPGDPRGPDRRPAAPARRSRPPRHAARRSTGAGLGADIRRDRKSSRGHLPRCHRPTNGAVTIFGAMEPEAAGALTVVIPVWDSYAGAALEDALASVCAQQPQPSVLVLDNASVTPIAVGDGVRLLQTEQRLSIGAARNHALLHVTTPWVMLWDADDVMLPGTLADLLARADRDPAAVVIAAGILDGSTGRRHHWPRSWTRPLSRLPRCYAAVHAISSLFPPPAR